MQVVKTSFLTAACAASTLFSTPAWAAGEQPSGGTSVTVVVSALASTSSAVKLYFYNVREKFLTHGGYASCG
ncbi:hypothetical protein [Hymenobacter sp. AT01-02]|uniref:hypothetical protein n=1 Tax=Hymenobacter sp. AT01-02 TaxID=1571877 RepID=UPI0005F24DD9|nr:hypothetical protein [Hymenobacter sp. AT01-02]